MFAVNSEIDLQPLIYLNYSYCAKRVKGKGYLIQNDVSLKTYPRYLV